MATAKSRATAEYVVELRYRNVIGQDVRNFLHDGKRVSIFSSKHIAKQDATIHCSQFRDVKFQVYKLIKVV